MSEYFIVNDRKFVPVVTPNPIVSYRLAWDDQNVDYNYKSRTLGMTDPGYNAPAVMRYYPIMREKAGDYRVVLDDNWKQTVIILNDGNERKFAYWSGPSRAQFNTNGWPNLMYVGMSGNTINVLAEIGDWYKFETLKLIDWRSARTMNIETHPQFIHRFTCVTWKNNMTVRIPSTGTQHGQVYYPLITNEGYAFIPKRHVVKAST